MKKAETITDDLKICKLGFSKVREEAEKIRGKSVLETI